MGEFVDRVRSFALVLGAPGLFLVSFLDSSFLPLPGITDVLLVVMVTRNPGAMLWYVVMTVAGSVAGCLVLHYIGRKGGEAVRDERGHEFYEEIGRKGGQKVRQLIEAGKRAALKK